MFQPTNRNIKTLTPMPGNETAIGAIRILVGDWYVDDVDHHGNPIAYRSDACVNRVLPDRGKFVICSDRGMFLRHAQRRNGRKGSVRHFETAYDAAVEAECLHAEARF